MATADVAAMVDEAAMADACVDAAVHTVYAFHEHDGSDDRACAGIAYRPLPSFCAHNADVGALEASSVHWPRAGQISPGTGRIRPATCIFS